MKQRKNIEQLFKEKFKNFEVKPPKDSWQKVVRKLGEKNKSEGIEHIFQEKFKDFEATPPKNSWTEIQNRLKEKKNKKNGVIPLWTKYSGVAAVLLLGFFVFKNNFDNPTIENSELVNNFNENGTNIDNNTKTETTTKEEDFTNSVVDNSNNNKSETTTKDDFNNSVVDNSNNNKTKTTTKEDFNNSVVDNSNNNQAKTTTKDDFNNSVVDNSNTKNSYSDNNIKTKITTKDDFNNSVVDNSNINNQITENDKISDNKQNKIENESYKDNFVAIDDTENNDKNTIKKDLLEEVKLAQEETEQSDLSNSKSFNKWRITPNAGAVAMNSLSEGSPISDKFTESPKEYQTSMSYGLGVDYSLTKKLSLRTGINKLYTAYNTNDIVVYVSADRVEVLENAMNIETTEKDIIVVAKKPSASVGDSKTEGHINQKMGYIEIPLELSYKLLENKFGIEIIGGISTLFLQENEVSVLSNQMKTTLGKANNLNQTHFSTNIGIGFRYEIFKSFDINVDPMFKYQLGTFDKNSGNFKPYLFGVYTGLSFKF